MSSVVQQSYFMTIFKINYVFWFCNTLDYSFILLRLTTQFSKFMRLFNQSNIFQLNQLQEGRHVREKIFQLIYILESYPRDESSMQRIVHATNCPCDELSMRRIVHATNCPRRIVRDELSVRRIVRVPTASSSLDLSSMNSSSRSDLFQDRHTSSSNITGLIMLALRMTIILLILIFEVFHKLANNGWHVKIRNMLACGTFFIFYSSAIMVWNERLEKHKNRNRPTQVLPYSIIRKFTRLLKKSADYFYVEIQSFLNHFIGQW